MASSDVRIVGVVVVTPGKGECDGRGGVVVVTRGKLRREGCGGVVVMTPGKGECDGLNTPKSFCKIKQKKEFKIRGVFYLKTTKQQDIF